DADRVRAQPVDGAIARHADEPRRRRPERHVVRVGLVPHLHEHFLQHFLRLAAIAKDAQDQSKQQPAVAIVQVRYSTFVSSDDPFYQRDVLADILRLHHQYAASRRRPSAILSAFGRFAASRMCENGQCVSGYVTRMTGASRLSKRSSMMTAAS